MSDKFIIKENQVWFSKSIVEAFRYNNKALSYGKAFYQFMRLEQCYQDKSFCDRLQQADKEKAKAMNISRIDMFIVISIMITTRPYNGSGSYHVFFSVQKKNQSYILNLNRGYDMLSWW